jgi:hypothetical protein
LDGDWWKKQHDLTIRDIRSQKAIRTPKTAPEAPRTENKRHHIGLSKQVGEIKHRKCAANPMRPEIIYKPKNLLGPRVISTAAL